MPGAQVVRAGPEGVAEAAVERATDAAAGRALESPDSASTGAARQDGSAAERPVSVEEE